MAKTETIGSRIRAICTCVTSERFDNLKDAKEFTQEEIRKVTAMAGIAARRVADDSACSSDLCEASANRVLEMMGWERDSIDAPNRGDAIAGLLYPVDSLPTPEASEPFGAVCRIRRGPGMFRDRFPEDRRK